MNRTEDKMISIPIQSNSGEAIPSEITVIKFTHDDHPWVVLPLNRNLADQKGV